jgi:hypothetical protein
MGQEVAQSYELLKRMEYTYDGLFTMHNSDFMKDDLFQECFKIGADTGSWGKSPASICGQGKNKWILKGTLQSAV